MIIQFKPEFENELKRLKVKKAFIRNATERVSKASIRELVNRLDSYGNFNEFVSAAFFWTNTPEGHSFWSTVAEGRHVAKFKGHE